MASPNRPSKALRKGAAFASVALGAFALASVAIGQPKPPVNTDPDAASNTTTPAGSRPPGAPFDTPTKPIYNSVPLTLPAYQSDKLVAGEVDMPTYDGHTIKAYRAYPKGHLKNAPVVLFQPMIVGECGLMHQDYVRRIAARGFYVIMPNMPHRWHPDACHDVFKDADPTHHTIVHDMVAYPDDAEQTLDMMWAMKYAAKEGASATKVGFWGYDGGARTAFKMLAHIPQLKAAISNSGPLVATPLSTPTLHESYPTPVDLADRLGGRMFAIEGAHDPQVKAEDIQQMRDALKKAGDDKTVILVYPNAGHGFMTQWDTTEDSKDAWNKAVDWLHSHGVK